MTRCRVAIALACVSLMTSACAGASSSSASALVPNHADVTVTPSGRTAETGVPIRAFHTRIRLTQDGTYRSWLASKDAAHQTLFVSVGGYLTESNASDADGQVAIVTGGSSSTFSVTGSITASVAGPLGSWVDAKNNLYVTNWQSRTVEEYRIGNSTPVFTYSDGLSDPVGVVTDSAGNVFVADYNNGHRGDVVEYSPLTNEVAHTYRVPGAALDVALDSHHNVFVDYLIPATVTSSIEEFLAGSGRGHSTGVTLGWAAGMLIDKQDRLVVSDQLNSVVDVLASPYNKVARRLTGGASLAFGDPTYGCLSANGKTLFMNDAYYDGFVALSYPSGRPLGWFSPGFGPWETVAVSCGSEG